MENTVGAFRSAGEAGVGEWELDVRFDVNGTPVVLHDATVDRVSPRSGPVSGLDATAGDGIATDDGQRIPTLREVYDQALAYHARVLTELKVMPTAAQWTAVTTQINETVGRSGVTLMSFERAVVLAARQEIPGAPTALIHSAGYLNAEQIEEYGQTFVKEQTAISASRAAEWRAAGVRLLAWTVDAESGWSRLSALPVDGFITDHPIAYEQWADQHCG
jgi:glycerophosphoryl diester phosphodiesterase